VNESCELTLCGRRVLTYSLVLHGGAGAWKGKRRQAGIRGIRRAVLEGMELLRRGESALETVEACVVVMEDDPVFNAGRGSSLNLLGRVEMDASIMDGRTLNAGAVAMLTRVKNPIRLARLIMERTDHVMMAGNGAEHLARLLHLETRNPLTKRARESWRLLKAQLQRGRVEHLPNTFRLLQRVPDLVPGGTVGAVALDSDGGIAAATSSGGLALKLPGRIGDTPLIGCGTYADSSGGCSVTGTGEGAIRLVLAKATCDFMQSGATAQQAVRKSVGLLETQLGMRIGLIAIDSRGRVGSAHSTRDLCWAFVKSGMRRPLAAMKS